MNELLLFGLPVVFNPISFIPFLLTPLALTVTSFVAIQLGLVPVTVHAVEWTTPVILSGYVATGSIAGSVLQIVNLAIGVLIYAPFLKLAQRNARNATKNRIQQLTDLVREHEKNTTIPHLLSQKGALGSMAKSLAGELSDALKNNQIELFYQPQVRADGTVTGAEALLRWNHPIAGYVYPPLVILLATQSGMLDELDAFILDQTGQKLQYLEKCGCNGLTLSVNLTANQLDDPKLVTQLKDLFETYGISPEHLGLELTEQTAFSDSSATAGRIQDLRALGVKIIMDDFGMGHTALTYLQNNQFDLVKLDGSLTRSMMENSRSREIISSIMQLAESLHFQVIAEYVETTEQMVMLQSLGCKEYQGYLFSPAVAFEDFLDFVCGKSGEKVITEKNC